MEESSIVAVILETNSSNRLDQSRGCGLKMVASILIGSNVVVGIPRVKTSKLNVVEGAIRSRYVIDRDTKQGFSKNDCRGNCREEM